MYKNKRCLIGVAVAVLLPFTITPANAQPDWDAVAECESSNTNANTGNNYYGYYQFNLETWAETGRSGNPTDYSKAEQTQAAQELYDSPTGGGGRWPTCVGGGGRGGSTPTPAKAHTHATVAPQKARSTPSYDEQAPTAPRATPTGGSTVALTG